jgi:prophage regulatory protein
MDTYNKPNSEFILRWPEVQKRVGLCRSQAHKLVSTGEFPAPIKLGARASGWLESDIQKWIEERIQQSQGGKS